MSRAGNVTITWTADQWRAAAIPALNAGLTAAAAVMADQAVRNFGTEGGGVAGSGHRIDVGTGKRLGPLRRWRPARYLSAPPGAFRGPFRLIFHGEAHPVRPQGIVSLVHSSLGRLEIFVVPIGPDPGSPQAMRYEAIFT